LSRRDGLAAALLAGAAATLYLSFPTRLFVFEGLARAMPIDAGLFSEVFKGNYLLYGFAGWCFHHLVTLLGARASAVFSLQIMDCLIGGAGVGVFYLTLRRLALPRAAAAAWSAVLAVSCAYWLWSTDAQNYIFSAFLLGLNFHFIARDASGERVPPWALGALHGLAILGHIVNGIFGLAGLAYLRARHGKSWAKPALQYAAASAAVAAGAYALVLLLIVRPESASAALHWFWGSLNRGRGGLRWHGQYDLESLRLWLKTSANVLAAFPAEYRRAQGGAGAQALLAAARGLALAFAVKLALSARAITGARRRVALFCASWLAVYAAIFISWEPMTMVYRVSDLFPALALLALGAETAGSSRRWGLAAAGLALCLGLGNFLAEVRPRALAENNVLLMRMRFVRASTPEESWVATPESQGGGEELYLPYFAERRPILLSVYRNQPEVLSRKLDAALAHGEPVFVTTPVLADDFWRGFFAAYRPERAADDGEGFELYRLEPPTARLPGARRRPSRS